MKRIKFIFSIYLLFVVFICNAQITKSVADTIVLYALGNDSTIRVYGMNESINRSMVVLTADGTELISPYENSYAYFIDDMPAANWVHPCRYCFVNKSDGTLTMINEKIYPCEHELFQRIGEKPKSANRWTWPYTNYTIPPKATPNSKLYAVLITGDSGADGSDIKLWYDLSCVYTTLVNKYGFMETTNTGYDHIMVCANLETETALENICPEGWNFRDLNQGGSNYSLDMCDFYYTYSNKYGIEEVFQNLSGYSNSLSNVPELEADDQLFVMLCGVGSKDNQNNSRIMINRGNNPVYLNDSELASWVRNIKCSQMTFLIECNYSGGFIDNLMNDPLAICKNRAVHTSTDETHLSWVEQYITCDPYRSGSDNFKVDEYIYYWAAASLGYYPILEISGGNYITGPWYRYDNTTIGQFQWSLFDGFNGTSHNAYDVNPNTNNDGALSMEEAFIFADNLDTYSHRGYFNPIEIFYYNNSTNTYDSCVEYPCHAYESSFTKELITLKGYRGEISNDAETGVGHSYDLASNIVVNENTTLTINNNSVIKGHNMMLRNEGTVVTNPTNSNATFNRLSMTNKAGTLSLSHCVFDTCGVISTKDGPCSITYSTFNQSTIYASIDEPQRDSYNIVISHDTINSTINSDAIFLDNIPRCNVDDNTITTTYDGIYLNRLSGVSSNYVISNNNVNNCGGSGIVAYASNGKLTGNTITYNSDDGLDSYNLSSLRVTGDSLATSVYFTQNITNNDQYQVHATNNSYPVYFHYNWLKGNGTSADYILFYESNNTINSRPIVFDVRYNCWSPLLDANIPSHLLLTGNASYNYLPTWTPSATPSSPDGAGMLLVKVDDYAEKGDYDNAKASCVQLIEDYPDSFEAIAAMKTLFAIEVETDGDFSDLKDYYLDLVSDDYLGDLADNLANRCDVRMKNYLNAIEWYEDKIADQMALYSERIFAEIDLGDLYLQMADNGIKGICGKMTEYVPASKDAHAERTRYLLSLLSKDVEQNIVTDYSQDTSDMIIGAKITCSPNPANDIINITSSENEGFKAIDIYTVDGRIVKSQYNSLETINISDLDAGVYIMKIKMSDGVEIVKRIIKQ